jgi:Bacteriophage HK97-gp10, putative tail-component
MAGSYVILDNAAIDRTLHGPTGPTAKALLTAGVRVESAMKRRCPVDRGRLRASIHHVLAFSTHLVVLVGTPVQYAAWVERGTGLYGPHAHRIVPVRAKVLVFTPRTRGPGGALIPRKNRTKVFVRSTRGMRAQPFMAPGLRDVFPNAIIYSEGRG